MKDLVFEQLTVALAGRYIPERELGHGAMASVYLARDLKHDRLVAIKVLRTPVDDPSAGERFVREIKFLAQLSHPHILPLFDSGDALGMLYYVTAYVDGLTLRRHLKQAQNGRLPVGEAARIIGEIADGLDYAHQRNVIHRDVKPENILLQDDHALLADFGIARAIQLTGDKRLTDTGMAIGTPAYMSPEQLAADRQLDARTDVFGLGCLAYEILAGVPPFMGARGVVDNTLKFTTGPKPISGLRPDVKAHIDEAIARALASDPAHRYATAGEFSQALDRARYLEGA
jgi:serine/threonine-protein kinase